MAPVIGLQDFLNEWNSSASTIQLQTSGSTGAPKIILAEKRAMRASAQATCRFLQLKAGDVALLCLPLQYIAGKMMVVRSIEIGMKLIEVPSDSHPLLHLNMPQNIDFCAMVPLQVTKSLESIEERTRLKSIKHLIIGGEGIPPQLEKQLKDFPHNVWSTYGMTETYSHIALRKLNGKDASLWYQPLPDVEISLNAENCLVIYAPHIHPTPLHTNDIAVIEEGRFKILGRKDNVIISGGIKIHIEEVEHTLSVHIKDPFLITKAPHKYLGEQVVMLTQSTHTKSIRALCSQHLPKYWQPKEILTVSQLPLTGNGKPNRKEAENIAIDILHKFRD